MENNTNEIKNYVEVKYITDSTTFFKMKEEQKLIAEELRTGKIRYENNKKLDDWYSKKPKDVEPQIRKLCDLGCYHFITNPDYPAALKKLNNWKAEKPNIPIYRFNEYYARAFNIIYSMVRGKTYKQVEQKVRENNEPSYSEIKKIIKEYNLDESYFNEALKNAR